MMRKHFFLVLVGSTILFLMGTALVLAPSATWWRELLGSLSILLAVGGVGCLYLLP